MARESARVAELADAQDLGSCGETRAGSTPASRICFKRKDLQPSAASPLFLVPRAGGRAGALRGGCVDGPQASYRVPFLRRSNHHGLARTGHAHGIFQDWFLVPRSKAEKVTTHGRRRRRRKAMSTSICSAAIQGTASAMPRCSFCRMRLSGFGRDTGRSKGG